MKIVLHNVSHWQLYALQTEEERGEGEVSPCRSISATPEEITIANLHMYRVVSSYQPFPYAIKVSDSRNIRSATSTVTATARPSFDSAVFDQTHNAEIRQREFGVADPFWRCTCNSTSGTLCIPGCGRQSGKGSWGLS